MLWICCKLNMSGVPQGTHHRSGGHALPERLLPLRHLAAAGVPQQAAQGAAGLPSTLLPCGLYGIGKDMSFCNSTAPPLYSTPLTAWLVLWQQGAVPDDRRRQVAHLSLQSANQHAGTCCHDKKGGCTFSIACPALQVPSLRCQSWFKTTQLWAHQVTSVGRQR